MSRGAAPDRRAALALLAGAPLLGAAPLRAATPGVDVPPPAQPPQPLRLPALHAFALDNGLQLVVAPRPGLPVLSIALLVRAGPETDSAGGQGAAAMAASLWPKGALRGGRPVPAAVLAAQAEALGGALESASSWGASTLSMTVTSARLEAALALLTDLLRHPLLAADALERARAQALDGLRVTLGNPAEVAALALRRGFWGDSPWGQVPAPAALQRLRRAEVLAFQARRVRPDQVALVLAGDIAPAPALALAGRLLGDWRAAGPPPAPPPAGGQPVPSAAPLVLIDLPGSGQSAVAVAAPFVASGDRASRHAGLVADAVLGGGYSARLNQEVRIRRGLSYGAASSAESRPGGGMFSAQAQTSHASAAAVLDLLRGEITRLADAPPGADELAARQATLAGSFARRLETSAGLAGLLVGQLAQGWPLADLATHVPQLLAVTPEQVQAFARQHWTAASLRAVVAGDLAAAGLGAAAQPQALRLTLAELDLSRPGLRRRR